MNTSQSIVRRYSSGRFAAEIDCSGTDEIEVFPIERVPHIVIDVDLVLHLGDADILQIFPPRRIVGLVFFVSTDGDFAFGFDKGIDHAVKRIRLFYSILFQ